MKKQVLKYLPPYLQYLISLLLVIAATYLKILFFNFIGPQTPFLMYTGVILIISRNFGKGPAFFSLIACMLTTNYYFMVPYYGFRIYGGQAMQLLFFGLEGYLIIMISEALTKALKDNHADSTRLSAILENSSDGIVVVNQEGKRTYCSPSVKNIIGYTDDEYLNLEPWKLGHPEELDDIKEQYRQLIATPGGGAVLLHRMKHKKGHWIWVESRVTNLLNDPQIQAMIANFNDVTRRVESDQSRKDFIGIVSHELKSPLTSIKLYGQTLVKKLDATNDQLTASLLSKMMQNTNHMENMIGGLTDAAIINAGRMELHIDDFDFNAMVYDILNDLQQTTDKHCIRVSLCDISSLSADRERLSQVIINLVSNAIKYSPGGGDIVLTSEKKNGSLFINIRDNGLGIPAKDADKVFDRLYRVDNTKHIKGLGLGLYICRQIIQLHGGAIGVESEEGKGSLFWFSVPLERN